MPGTLVFVLAGWQLAQELFIKDRQPRRGAGGAGWGLCRTRVPVTSLCSGIAATYFDPA